MGRVVGTRGQCEVGVGVKQLSAAADLLVLGCGVDCLGRALCFIMEQ